MTVALTIDDKIHGYKQPPQSEIEPKEVESISPEEKEEEQHQDEGQDEVGGEKEAPEDKEHDEPESEVEAKSDSDLDEYGNEIPKARTYTEEEVQRMIRDRLSRGHHAQQQTPQQQQQRAQASEGFESDPDSSESWEAQLDAFIDRRLETRELNAQRQQWERQEQLKQSDFESKFTTGMEKYKDFQSVVGALPITDSIMIATREMKDPAAFLYAAAKTQPEEIKRIASLSNPIHQATEIGRLEEKIKKARAVSNSARPLANTKSDFSSDKVQPKRSIDDLINKHAKSKIRR